MFEPYQPKNSEAISKFAAVKNSQLPRFFAVYLGLNPLMDTFIPVKDFDSFCQACEKEDLIVSDNGVMTVINTVETDPALSESLQINAVPFTKDRYDAFVHVLISKKRNIMEEARRFAWHNLPVGNYNLTRPLIDTCCHVASLGYPDCCIRFYASHSGRFNIGRASFGWNTPIEIYKNTGGKLSFLCNYFPMDKTYFLTSHYPCSFSCKRTMDKAKALLEGIRDIEPEYAELIESYLKLPYLVFDEKRAFVFNGRLEANTIYYSESRFLGEMQNIYPYQHITAGNMLQFTPDDMRVFRDNEMIALYPNNENEGKLFLFS